MAKRESTFLNMVLALFLVTFVASSALAFIYEFTREPIELAKKQKKNKAIHAVLPEFDNNPGKAISKQAINKDTVYFYKATMEDSLAGYAVETFTRKGFSGEIRLMVGFLPDGTIQKIAVLEHQETPGLGDKIEADKSDWSRQFQGKNPAEFILKVKKDGGDVDAITAATISSRAYCDAVDRAYETFKGIQNSEFSLPDGSQGF